MVIGAGISGLAAAARLSVKGHAVTVVERAATFGGKVSSFARDGFVFDTGPSLVTLPAVYRDLFLKTGTALEDNVDLQPVEPGFTYTWADGTTVQLPGVGPSAIGNRFGDGLGGTAASQWRALMMRGADIWQLTRKPVIETPIEGARDLLPLARNLSDVRTVAPLKSLDGLGRHMLRDPRLRMVLNRYATYTGSDPRKAPAALVTIPYIEQTFGIWHVGGGVHRLANALVTRCLERNVDLRPLSEVSSVLLRDGAVSGVALAGGETIAADIVVSNVDATHLYRDLLAGPLREKPLQKLGKATPSLSGFSLLLAVRGRTPGISHHNVWFPPKYELEFDAIFSGRVAADPAIYACVPSDPLMHPDGCEAWSILVNAPRHGLGRSEFDWLAPHVASRYADRILGLLARRGTDLRDRILWREIRTPADIEQDSGSPGGSIYGTSSNGVRAAFLRPANKSPIEGLYLVGGSAHPGGGLPLVGLSAEIVANQIGRAKRR